MAYFSFTCKMIHSSLENPKNKIDRQRRLGRFIIFMRKLSIVTMGGFYFFVGWQHLVVPEFFLRICPPFLPFAEESVLLSGIWEMGVGLFLLIPKTRKIAGAAAVLLLIAVYPANLYMYFDPVPREFLGFSKMDALIRLFFQIPLVIIAIWHMKPQASTTFGVVCSALFFPTIIYFLTL